MRLPGFPQLNLNELERKTLLIVLISSICGGMLQAVMVVIPELILKTLQADHFYIAIVTLLWPMGQMAATYWSAYLDGKPQKSGVLRVVALVGRTPLAFAALFDAVPPMLFFFLFMILTNPAVLASQHAIVHSNYRRSIRGKLYSYTVVINTLSILLSALLYGFVLDMNPQNYRWILIFAAAAGAAEALILAQANIQTPLRAVFLSAIRSHQSLWERVSKPWKDFVRLFSNDREFFRFEISFFVYGLGFMIMQPFITIFLAQDLALSYTQIAMAKSVILQTGVIFMSPLTGQIFDKKNPVLFGSYIFLLIAIFPVMMTLTGFVNTDHPEWFVYASYAVLSIGWSGLTLLWNLGSMFFANDRDVSRYSGAHVVMVGLRGALAMGMVVFIVDLIPATVAFITTAMLWLCASLLMFWHWKQRYRGVSLDEQNLTIIADVNLNNRPPLP
jgi:MFS family permease